MWFLKVIGEFLSITKQSIKFELILGEMIDMKILRIYS